MTAQKISCASCFHSCVHKICWLLKSDKQILNLDDFSMAFLCVWARMCAWKYNSCQSDAMWIDFWSE